MTDEKWKALQGLKDELFKTKDEASFNLDNKPFRVLRLVYNKMTVTLDANTINYIKLLEYEGDDGKAWRFEFYNTADGHIVSFTPSASLGLERIQRLYDEVCLLVLFTWDDFYATLTKEQLLKCPKI